MQQVKSKNVLQIEVEVIEKELAILEKNINKVVTLSTEQYRSVYTFGQNITATPFRIYIFDKKLYFVTQKNIVGPYITGEIPKEYPLPNNETSLASDIDNDGRIYITSGSGKIYLFDK